MLSELTIVASPGLIGCLPQQASGASWPGRNSACAFVLARVYRRAVDRAAAAGTHLPVTMASVTGLPDDLDVDAYPLDEKDDGGTPGSEQAHLVTLTCARTPPTPRLPPPLRRL